MIEKYVEICDWYTTVSTAAQMDTYNLMRPLYDLMVEAGLSPVMGDIVTAFGLPGTAAKAYCMPRMLSLELETNLYMVLSFACTQDCVNDLCSVTQKGGGLIKDLFLTIISDRRSEGLGINSLSVAQPNSTNNVYDTYMVKGIKIFRGSNSTVFGFIRRYIDSTKDYQQIDPLCITKIKYNNVERTIVIHNRGKAIYKKGTDELLETSDTLFLDYSTKKPNDYTLVKGYIANFAIENLDCSNICKLILPTINEQYVSSYYNSFPKLLPININNEWYITLDHWNTTFQSIIKL